jgi:hypothetical protein
MPPQRSAVEREAVVSEPATATMGRLDAFDIGSKKLTVQTEFLSRPTWRVETKIYVGGALKKVYTEDLSSTPEPELQKRVDTFHLEKMDEIVTGLRRLSQ